MRPGTRAPGRTRSSTSSCVAARSETDDAKRKQMYGDMQALVHEGSGIGIPVFASILDGHSAKLKGLRPMQVPKLEKIVINMGVGEATGDQKMLDAAVDELTAIAGQKPVKTIGEEGDRRIQDPQGPADRLQGDAAQGAHVRVPGPAGHHRDAARARLPRHRRQGLRRARQLRDGNEGADRVPGDQLRPGGNRCVGWTSSSSPRPRRTRKRRRC